MPKIPYFAAEADGVLLSDVDGICGENWKYRKKEEEEIE